MGAKLGRRQFDVYVEIDAGMHRVGVATPEKALTLARAIADSSHLTFGGLLFYPGHIRQDVGEQAGPLAQLSATLARYTDTLRNGGLPPPGGAGAGAGEWRVVGRQAGGGDRSGGRGARRDRDAGEERRGSCGPRETGRGSGGDGRSGGIESPASQSTPGG
mgnify:CR=1 FL=1